MPTPHIFEFDQQVKNMDELLEKYGDRYLEDLRIAKALVARAAGNEDKETGLVLENLAELLRAGEALPGGALHDYLDAEDFPVDE
jgi:hypothetical protein